MTDTRNDDLRKRAYDVLEGLRADANVALLTGDHELSSDDLALLVSLISDLALAVPPNTNAGVAVAGAGEHGKIYLDVTNRAIDGVTCGVMVYSATTRRVLAVVLPDEDGLYNHAEAVRAGLADHFDAEAKARNQFYVKRSRVVPAKFTRAPLYLQQFNRPPKPAPPTTYRGGTKVSSVLAQIRPGMTIHGPDGEQGVIEGPPLSAGVGEGLMAAIEAAGAKIAKPDWMTPQVEAAGAEALAQARADARRDAFALLESLLVDPPGEVIKAMAECEARDDEGPFPPLMDLIDFSGENKTRTVLRSAWTAGVEALRKELGA